MLTTGSFKIYTHTHIYYFIYHVLKEIHIFLGAVFLKFIFCTIIIKIFMAYFLTMKAIHF